RRWPRVRMLPRVERRAVARHDDPVTMTQLTTRPELLEREDVLAALDEALADATGGRGRIVFVGGEAGVGKTALVRRFVESGVGDARVLNGGCDPLFTPRPLGPFVDIARATGGELDELVAAGAIPYRVAE